jgi:EamA domain-containing membrane protein RarD
MSRKNSGYLLVFSAGILWGTIGLFVKQMELEGSSPIETAFLRVFFAFLILLVICICRGGWQEFPSALCSLQSFHLFRIGDDMYIIRKLQHSGLYINDFGVMI